MKLNKKDFINELSNILSYSEDKCVIINKIFERNFFFSKKNKSKIMDELTEELEVNPEEATVIYDAAIKLINDEVKNKLKHPFRSKN